MKKDDTVTTEFAYRLHIAMMARNMKQKDIVEKTGITAATLSSYSQGHRQPTLVSIKLIAEALDVSSDYLIGLEESW